MIILSKRKVMKSKANIDKYFFDICFEWEDILGKVLDWQIDTRSNFEVKFDECCRKFYKKIRIPVYRMFRLFDKRRNNVVFMYDMTTKEQDGIYNEKTYIPCIIDYFLTEERYPNFIHAYRNNPFVMISSREVYEYLIEKKCPLKIYHLALSIPDNYVKMDVRYEKKFDLVMFARQNPVLEQYVERYAGVHEDFKLLKRRYDNGHYIYYDAKTAETVCYGDTREQYMDIVRMSKVALYTTPGMDGTREKAGSWNQVTPHFLEEVAGQCHVIARYPDNADTRWYEINQICKCVESYEEFEQLMDRYRKEDVDLEAYEKYLQKHVTSQRARVLRDIMKENQII